MRNFGGYPGGGFGGFIWPFGAPFFGGFRQFPWLSI